MKSINRACLDTFVGLTARVCGDKDVANVDAFASAEEISHEIPHIQTR